MTYNVFSGTLNPTQSINQYYVGSRSCRGKEHCREKCMPEDTTVSCAEMAEPIEMSFGLWTPPRKHVL